MELQKDDIAKMIEISAVQMPNGEEEIKELVKSAKQYSFACVYTLPCWVSYLKELMRDDSSTHLASTVGFPSGAHSPEVKMFEAEELIKHGIQELDLVMNVGMLRSGRHDFIKKEIKALVEITEGIVVKVILEVDYLTHNEIKKGCEICINAGADFVKTSTGWIHENVKLEIISMITSFVGNAIKVKAAGGIRELNNIIEMYKLGVTRFGINTKAAIKILHECDDHFGELK